MPHRKKEPGSNSVLRVFCLERREDESGVSGTGVVALGVVLPSGRAVIEWTTELSSVALYDSLDMLDRIHSHGGRTVVRFLDEAPTALVTAAVEAAKKTRRPDCQPEANR